MTLVLLLIGIIASVVGYIGCFSVVQGAESSGEALIWVSLEAGLSVLRVILWGWNPKKDDAPPLEIKLELDEHSPLPTCTQSAELIEDDKILPLVRAPEFLETVTSYTGLLKQFSDPTQALTLYYTLTRRNNTTSAKPELGEHVLYITLFHHTERTTRVYAKDYKTDDGALGSEMSHFYLADELMVDLEHGILRTKIGHQIKQMDDPIAGNADVQTLLQAHYQSILNQLNQRIRLPPHRDHDVLLNQWTLKVGEAQSEMQEEGGKTDGRGNESSEKDRMTRDEQYPKQGLLERQVRALIKVRGKWIQDYMEWLYSDIDRMLAKVEGIEITEKERTVVLTLAAWEQEKMENILLHEVYGWENKLREGCEDFVQSNSGPREQLERIWRASSWERLEEGRWAMETRMNEVESSFLRRVADAGKEGADENCLKQTQSRCKDSMKDTWSTLLASDPTTLSSPQRPTPSEHLELILEDLQDGSWQYDMALADSSSKAEESRFLEGLRKMETRLRREINSVEDRLNHGFEACQSWSSRGLVQYTHSDSKWLYPDRVSSRLNPLSYDDAIRRALTNNKYVRHIDIPGGRMPLPRINQLFEMTRDMPACTSVTWDGMIPDSVELPSNILSISITHHNCQLSQKHKDTLNSNMSQLDGKRTTFEFKDMSVWHGDLYGPGDCSFTIEFLGPPSGHLKLQLIHRSTEPKGHLAVELGPDNSRRNIHLSDTFTLENLTIMSRPLAESTDPVFAPGVRNHLTCTFKAETGVGYFLRDINLLNENGLPYDPANKGKDADSNPAEKTSVYVEEVARLQGEERC